MGIEQPPKIVPFRQHEKVALYDKPTLVGEIMDMNVEIFSQLIEAEALQAGSRKAGAMIDIVIKSRGGDNDEALILVQDILRIRETYGVKIRAYAKGYADSSATFIVAMCDERIALGHTEFLLHEPRLTTEESSEQTLEESRIENYETRVGLRRMQKMLAKRLNKPLSEIITEYKKDKPMNEHQAMEFGLIDKAIIYQR